jgi:hypothetical protein
VSWAVDQYTIKHSTVRQANAWALAEHVNPKSRIVFDDLAYFDRRQFPNAHLFGGVLTWPAVERLRPDYIVLSSSLFDADWMQKLIGKQRLARFDPDPYNVHLYQDLLTAKKPGPTKVHGIALVKILQPDPPIEPSRLLDLASECNALCDLKIVNLRTELDLAGSVEQRVRALSDTGDTALSGPELRIYRVTRLPAAGAVTAGASS